MIHHLHFRHQGHVRRVASVQWPSTNSWQHRVTVEQTISKGPHGVGQFAEHVIWGVHIKQLESEIIVTANSVFLKCTHTNTDKCTQRLARTHTQTLSLSQKNTHSTHTNTLSLKKKKTHTLPLHTNSQTQNTHFNNWQHIWRCLLLPHHFPQTHTHTHIHTHPHTCTNTPTHKQPSDLHQNIVCVKNSVDIIFYCMHVVMGNWVGDVHSDSYFLRYTHYISLILLMEPIACFGLFEIYFLTAVSNKHIISLILNGTFCVFWAFWNTFCYRSPSNVETYVGVSHQVHHEGLVIHEGGLDPVHHWTHVKQWQILPKWTSSCQSRSHGETNVGWIVFTPSSG